jgi:hypothetical protein
MRFSDEGLVLGAGTILIEGRGAGRDSSIEALDSRLRALRTVAHVRPPTPSAFAHIRAATERWRQGYLGLAGIHLALSRLQRLERPEADAQRLFLADELMNQGVEAASILKALDLPDRNVDGVGKYSPDQPRVPAGSGRSSGQWTADGGQADQSVRSGTHSNRPLLPQSEVNPATITPVAGRHVGDDACHRAAADCLRHVLEYSQRCNPANQNWSSHWALECKITEETCENYGAILESSPRRGHVIALFPDGGVVIIQKGSEDVYIPATPQRRRIF